MSKFEFNSTSIEGVLLIKPFVAVDIRGAFIKDYSEETFEKNGAPYKLKEVFYTVSNKCVIRALHFQRVYEQAKLVRCISGKIFDVVVDLRKDSTTFKNWISFELSSDNHHEVLIPKGCGHGYLVLEESIVSYKCDEKFYPEYDDGIIWNDPDINVEWPLQLIDNEVILADKDKNLQTFQQFIQVYGGL